MDTSRILELSAKINESTKLIHDTLREKGLSLPSFQPDAVVEMPPELIEVRDTLLDATSELHDLFLSPLELLFHHGAHNNLVCMQAIVRFNIPQIFEPNEKISYTHIAEKVGVEERLVRRLLKHAATMRIFDCSEGDLVGHTTASNQLRRPEVHDWMSVACSEMWPSATRVVDALEKWPNSDEPGETGFALARGDGESIYSVIMKTPSLAKTFQGAMAAYASQPGMAVSHITNNYDWNSLSDGKVVDLGGGRGHVAIPLVEKYPSLRITVQDIPPVVAGADTGVPPHLSDRVQFMPHDIFTEQPLQADCFYLRWVLHNWADSYAVKILRALIPALRPGNSIVIQDIVVPENKGPDSARWKEKMIRAADINMLGVFNSYERSASEWEALFAAADSRFKLKKIVEPVGSTLAIIEAYWNVLE